MPAPKNKEQKRLEAKAKEAKNKVVTGVGSDVAKKAPEIAPSDKSKIVKTKK